MPRRPKRFYKQAEAAPASGGYEILLDGKPVRTPARQKLLIPYRRLAEAVAEEWGGQGNEIVIGSMPLTRLTFTSIDRVAPDRDATIGQIAAYGASDLLCYRAAIPAGLASRQAEAWDPLLAWARDALGISLATGEGLTPIAQPESSLTQLRRVLAERDVFTLGCLHSAATLTGSAVVALALGERVLDSARAFAVSHLDETYQAEKWGEDVEAKRGAGRKAAELEIIERTLQLMRE